MLMLTFPSRLTSSHHSPLILLFISSCHLLILLRLPFFVFLILPFLFSSFSNSSCLPLHMVHPHPPRALSCLHFRGFRPSLAHLAHLARTIDERKEHSSIDEHKERKEHSSIDEHTSKEHSSSGHSRGGSRTASFCKFHRKGKKRIWMGRTGKEEEGFTGVIYIWNTSLFRQIPDCSWDIVECRARYIN